MAKKTNITINGKEYYRTRKTIGRDREGNPIRKPFYGKNKTESERQRDEWADKRRQGLKIDKHQSVTQAMYTWLWNIEYVSGNKNKTFERYEGIYRNYVEKSDLGYLYLDSIESVTIQQHYTALHNSGSTYSQLKNLNKLLSKFFAYCAQERHIISNPCKGIKLGAYKPEDQSDLHFNDMDPDLDLEDEGKIETLAEDDLKKLSNIRNRKLRILARLAVATGLREGELLAADVQDVKDMTICVTKTLSHVKVFDRQDSYHYEYKVTRPKSKKSKRKVPIPSEMKADLAELNRIRAEEKLKLGEIYQSNNLLFPSSTGTFIDHRNLLRSWKRALEDIGVDYKKFHALRHTYGTQLLAKGVDIVTVSRLMGHASIKTTEIYVHVVKSLKKEAVEVLNSIL